jgi:hypothetical protein
MSHTFTTKVTKGELKKIENEKEKKIEEAGKLEAIEAKSWEDKREVTGNELKLKKKEDDEKRKKMLAELYEKEMNEK